MYWEEKASHFLVNSIKLEIYSLLQKISSNQFTLQSITL